MRVAARFAETDMLLRVHSGRNQGQKVRTMASHPHAAAMRFSYHSRVDVPTPKSSRLNMLRTENLGQGNGPLDVPRIGLGLYPLPLITVESPVAVELKAAIPDPRTRKRAGCHRVGIRHHRCNGRTLIPN